MSNQPTENPENGFPTNLREVENCNDASKKAAGLASMFHLSDGRIYSPTDHKELVGEIRFDGTVEIFYYSDRTQFYRANGLKRLCETGGVRYREIILDRKIIESLQKEGQAELDASTKLNDLWKKQTAGDQQ